MSCPKCGGTMLGDGYTTHRHCEFTEPPDDIEADAPATYCDFDDMSYSECCGIPMPDWPDYDLCPSCLEHSQPYEEDDGL